MTRPGLHQGRAAFHILWIRAVNLVEKCRDSLPTSFDVFIAAILLDGMCAEKRESCNIEAEVTEHFELVIILLNYHVYLPIWEVPDIFLVISCWYLWFCGNHCCCHLPSS